jgi:hypothetical protein
MARLRWDLAVAGLTNSCPAISSLDSPAPTSALTSRSRSVDGVCGQVGLSAGRLSARRWGSVARVPNAADAGIRRCSTRWRQRPGTAPSGTPITGSRPITAS